MENSLEKLEQIMKPYFDKKKEIEGIANYITDEKTEFERELADLDSKKEQSINELNQKLVQLKESKKLKILELKAKRDQSIKELKLRLERLRDSKEKEIQEYLEQLYLENPTASPLYISMVKKDLDKAYAEQEKDLNDRIESLKRTTEQEIRTLKSDSNDEKELINEMDNINKEFKVNADVIDEKINNLSTRPNYSRVYEKELFNLKGDIRKKLFAYKKELDLELQREKMKFDNSMLDLSEFKYEYNDQHQVTNGSKWRALYERSNQIIDKINNIKEALKALEKNLDLTDFKNDKYISLAPWEQAEYDRRNKITNDENNINVSSDLVDIENKINNDENNRNVPKDLVDTYTPVKSDFSIVDGEYVVDDYEKLSSLIYNEIVDIAKNMRSVKLDFSSDENINDRYYFSDKENKNSKFDYKGVVYLNKEKPIRLPNNEYIYSDDIKKAIKNYYKKNKGQRFYVNEVDKTLTISRETVRKLRKSLKVHSTIILLEDKKLSDFDVKKVFGKERFEKIKNMVDIGTIKTKLPVGEYISRNEFISKLNKTLTSENWLKKLNQKFKRKDSHKVDQVDTEVVPEQFFEDDLFEISEDSEEHVNTYTR